VKKIGKEASGDRLAEAEIDDHVSSIKEET
jgi:hypothetical protein